MKSLRITIAGLMGLVLVAGLGLAALRDAGAWSASLMFTGTLCVFGTTALGAFFLRGGSRAGCVGATLWGIGYLVLAFGPWFSTELRPHLATSRLIDAVYPAFRRDVTYSDFVRRVYLDVRGTLPQPHETRAFLADTDPRKQEKLIDSLLSDERYIQRITASKFLLLSTTPPEPFERTGHSLLALFFGFIGALLARYFEGSGGERRTGVPTSVPNSSSGDCA